MIRIVITSLITTGRIIMIAMKTRVLMTTIAIKFILPEHVKHIKKSNKKKGIK